MDNIESSRMMFSRVENGHGLELGWYHDQGGGIEEVWVWCHTCDPEGDYLFKRDLRFLQ